MSGCSKIRKGVKKSQIFMQNSAFLLPNNEIMYEDYKVAVSDLLNKKCVFVCCTTF